RGSAKRLRPQSIRACVVPKAASDAWLSTLEVLQFRRVRTRVFRPSHAANSRGVGPERAENGMQCDSCGKPATVHLTDVSNNSKQELHLCEDCANAQGVTIKSYLQKASLPELLPHVADAQVDVVVEKDLVCPRCGMSYRKFRATGKFGCPNDYVVFKKG